MASPKLRANTFNWWKAPENWYDQQIGRRMGKKDKIIWKFKRLLETYTTFNFTCKKRNAN